MTNRDRKSINRALKASKYNYHVEREMLVAVIR